MEFYQVIFVDVWNDPVSIRNPFLLTSLVINEVNTDTEISIELCTHKITTIVLEASWSFNTFKVLEQICPNFSNDTGTLIQNITQVAKNEKGKLVKLSVGKNHSDIQRLAKFMPKTKNWGMDVVKHFFTHLTSQVKKGMINNGYDQK